jgi:2-methylisocitrate lyase-like PEP mutase family enzyme
LTKPEVIAKLCAAIDTPVNVEARTESPDLAELGRLGVARVSTATRLAIVALSAAREAAGRLQNSGRFDDLDAAIGYESIQRLFVNPENNIGGIR